MQLTSGRYFWPGSLAALAEHQRRGVTPVARHSRRTIVSRGNQRAALPLRA